MAAGAESKRRPLLGTLLLVLSGLVGASLLSSPPWAGPARGLPRNACGLVGRIAASFLLGGLGLPLAVWGGVV